jgi:hypothetical protein
MPTLRNISPLGDLYVDGHGVVVAGADFDVTEEQAISLVHQLENFELVGTTWTPPAVDEGRDTAPADEVATDPTEEPAFLTVDPTTPTE